MDRLERDGVAEHLRVVGERVLEEGWCVLERMSQLYEGEREKRSSLLYWPLEENPSEMRLVPMRELEEGEDKREYVYYHFITVFREFFQEEKFLSLKEWKEYQSLEQVSRLFLEKARVLECPFHWEEKRVNRKSHKLTFPLEDSVVRMNDISYGSNFSWSRPLSSPGECQMILYNATIYLTEPLSHSRGIKLFLSGASEITLDHTQYTTTPDGRLMLEELIWRGGGGGGDGVFAISLSSDFSVVFSEGGSALVRNAGGIICFNLDSCLMEYWSHKNSPFPCRFHLHDVDHLLNFERVIAGEKWGEMSPGSKERERRPRQIGGHSDSINRLSLLRSIHVQYVDSFPAFFYQGQPLKVLEFNARTQGKIPFYILFHCDDFSLAKFRVRPHTLEIDFDLIDLEDSRPYDRHVTRRNYSQFVQ